MNIPEAVAEAPTEPGPRPRLLTVARPLPKAAGIWRLNLDWAAGLLLYICYFPVALGMLGWIALVPVLAHVRSAARPWRIYLGSWIIGLAFYWPVIAWMRVADDRMYYTWGALATYCSLYLPVSVWLLRLLDRRTRLPLVLTVPVVWTALEFVRAHLLTGFAWYFLGHTQHDFLEVIQVADIGGAYAVTFLVAAVNALVFEWLSRARWFRWLFFLREPETPRRFRPLLLQSAAVLLFFATVFAYGTWRLGQTKFDAGPRVSLIQSNLVQGLRIAASGGGDGNAALHIERHICGLSEHAAQQHHPDLIVWPETSWPNGWTEVASELPARDVPAEWRIEAAESRSLAQNAARRWKTNILLGLNTQELLADHRQRRANSAILVQPDGHLAGRYDKMHRVPFGEYVPMRDWFPWMNTFAPYDFDYSITPGAEFTRFPLNGYHFGVIICYEDTDPILARQYFGTPGQPDADFLVNISNDGWFNGTAEHEEHLAICRFRAVECRRAIARSVNMGISAVIDGNGHVLWPEYNYRVYPDGRVHEPANIATTLDQEWRDRADPPDRIAPSIPFIGRFFSTHWRTPYLRVREWPEFKKVAGVITTPIPIDTRTSLYVRWGDWLPWSCWGVLGLGIVWALVRPSRRQVAVTE